MKWIVTLLMAQDTGKFRTNTKDQYYTKVSVAKQCVDNILRLLPNTKNFQWIEPSAGNGSFLKAVPSGFDLVGIDIDPQASGIVKADFLQWIPASSKQKIVFGNPPFGRQSCLAKAFLKHACSFADCVAFILPRSFLKPSMSRAIPQEFHCVLSKPIEENAFEVNGGSYDVPSIFQIWEKRTNRRPVTTVANPAGFSYVKSSDTYHIAFRRVGVNAGHCMLAPGTFNENTHYFLKLEEQYIPSCKKIIEQVNQHVFPSNTVGPRSLSKSEANEVLNVILQEISS